MRESTPTPPRDSPATPPPPAPAGRRPRRWGIALLGLAALAALAWGLRRRSAARDERAEAASATAQRDRPVPVLVARVERRDVPLRLEGLGTVAAYATVTVRPRVDGRLESVLFTEGQSVRRGDVLAQIDPRPFQIELRQAEAVAARDRAQLRVARLTLERTRAMVARNLVAQADLEAAQGAVAQFEAAVRAGEAQAAAARLSIDYARVTSPIDGVTGLRQVDAGNFVRASDANGIVVVTQVDPIAVLFQVPQDELPRVAEGMARGPLAVEVFSRDGEERLGEGTLAVLDNQVNAATATLRLKAVLPNPGRRLWPSQFVKARLLVATRRGALVAPAAAVQRGPQGAFVYVVGADGRASMRPVRVERVEGEQALVAEGLSDGERVVTEGQSRLRNNARVEARAPEGGGAGGGRRGGGGARDGGASPARPGGP